MKVCPVCRPSLNFCRLSFNIFLSDCSPLTFVYFHDFCHFNLSYTTLYPALQLVFPRRHIIFSARFHVKYCGHISHPNPPITWRFGRESSPLDKSERSRKWVNIFTSFLMLNCYMIITALFIFLAQQQMIITMTTTMRMFGNCFESRVLKITKAFLQENYN